MILVELQETMGNDRSIANAAWTSSYDKDKREIRTDEQVKTIVEQLAINGHSVPFESVIFRFWIRMPLMIDREHMTHRIASHSGLSGRYRTMPTDYYKIPDDVYEIIRISNIQAAKKYEESCSTATENYLESIAWLKVAEKNKLITNQQYKRAREVLRGQLPLACYTERTTIMNLRSFANYQRLRNSPNAQVEIQQVAKLMLETVEKENCCPIAIKSLQSIGWRI